jgi:hypothetical protein
MAMGLVAQAPTSCTIVRPQKSSLSSSVIGATLRCVEVHHFNLRSITTSTMVFKCPDHRMSMITGAIAHCPIIYVSLPPLFCCLSKGMN